MEPSELPFSGKGPPHDRYNARIVDFSKILKIVARFDVRSCAPNLADHYEEFKLDLRVPLKPKFIIQYHFSMI